MLITVKSEKSVIEIRFTPQGVLKSTSLGTLHRLQQTDINYSKSWQISPTQIEVTPFLKIEQDKSLLVHMDCEIVAKWFCSHIGT